MPRPTNENLEQYAHAPLMRYLIATAIDGSTMTYGEAKSRLEREEDFTTIFSTKMGYVVGTLMERIQSVDPEAPLLNVLLVSQTDRMPSEGAGSFMARRFDIPRLAESDARTRYTGLWQETFEAAAQEAYSYTRDAWAELYQRVFEEQLPMGEVQEQQERRRRGTENDGLNYGRLGEGENHRALRLWVQENPGQISADYLGCRSETEVCLASGDRVDAVFYARDRIVVVEVKSRDSNEADYRRGVFQCIKYRAVQQAMDVREESDVEPVLVTEQPLSGEIRDLLRLHDIAHFQAPMDR